MPHNNNSNTNIINNSNMPQQQDNAFSSAADDTRIVRPTPTTASPPPVLAHFRGGNIPTATSTSLFPTTIPQGPPVIHRGPVPFQGANAIYTVYVPAPNSHHHQASPQHMLNYHHQNNHYISHNGQHHSVMTTALGTISSTATAMTPSIHMVPTQSQYDDYSTGAGGISNSDAKTLPLSSSSQSSASADPKLYATPENSNSASSDDETATTTKQANHSTTGSFDSQHAAAHSVLLLASGSNSKTSTPEKRKYPGSPTGETVDGDNQESSSKVPLKKRKMVSEIWLRAKQQQQQREDDEDHSSFHVSPVSHGSKTTGVTTWSPDRSQASNGSSYGDDQLIMKGGQALPENAKITEGKTIAVHAAAPIQTVTTVRHFPSELYSLLEASSGENANVLQWCSNGKAWRIVRWDALRKSLLPNHFGGASVDSFLSEISAWGFAEIISGTDAGAYSHTLFRKGFPNLCKEICRLRELKSILGSCSSNNSLHDEESKPVRSNAGTPSILQVPSLGDVATNTAEENAHSENNQTNLHCGSNADSNSTSDSTDSNNRRSSSCTPTNSNRSSRDEVSAAPSAEPVVTISTTAQPSIWPIHTQPQVYIPYRQQDDHFIDHHQYQHPYAASHQPHGQTLWNPVAAAHTEISSPTASLPSYSPVRVRSGRGAARLPAQRLSARHPVTVTPNSNANRRVVAPHAPRSHSNYRVVSNRGRRSGSAAMMSNPRLAPSLASKSTSSPTYQFSSDPTVTSSAPAIPSAVASSPSRSAMKQHPQTLEGKDSPVVSFTPLVNSSDAPHSPPHTSTSTTRSSPAMTASTSPVHSSNATKVTATATP